MKNTKILISEISRINELMGVQLLSEQAFAKVADDVINFFRKSGKSIDDATFDLLNNLKRATSDYEIGRILTDISKKSPEIGKKIVQTYTDVLKKDPSSPFNTLKNNLLDGINNQGLTKDEASKLIDDYVRDFEFDGLKTALRKELDDFADETLSKKTGSAYTNTPTKSGGGIDAETLNKSASKWFSGLDSAGLTRTEKLLLNKTFPHQKLLVVIKTFQKQNLEKYLDDVYGTMKEMTSKVRMSSNEDDLLKKLETQIMALKGPEVSLNNLKENILKSLREAKGPKGETIDYATIRKIEEWFGKMNTQQFEAAIDADAGIKNSTLFKIKDEILNKEFSKILQRVSGLITYGSMRLRQEWMNTFLRAGGGTAGVKTVYFYATIATKLIYPILGAVALSIGGLSASFGLTEGKDFMDRLYDNLKYNLWDTWFDDRSLSEKIQKLLNPFTTYIDDIYNKVINPASKGELLDIKLPKQEEVEKALEPIKDELPSPQDLDLGDTTATEEQPVTEPSGTYGTTLGEFKRYLASADGWGAEDYKTLTNVETRDINGITYYLAFDTDNVTYYYFYQDGKFKPNTN